ncbi:D-serine ammonia-lyase [Ureibacillus sp. 179-F W5.1 NHS]|uniref:Probable D-serine dehydratase n=1 Tax=Lysinibacillus halotolerans TaxID=1368476 RepID=A0A3M8HEI9_9BACI|nr:D-serine ammonia-lyase [Lysinibacillus halotolerans]RND00797.1 D-serine ammonia-lyase [Lysinibacillus halotolerans]
MRENKQINQLYQQHPLLKKIASLKKVLWLNPFEARDKKVESFSFHKVLDAEQRLKRFSSYLKIAFPETEYCNGIIESDIKNISNFRHWLQKSGDVSIQGKLLLKCDHALPISGSIKARGGIYEVLKFAEQLALENQMIRLEDDYSIFHSESFRTFFNQYKIAVGSTGNLGLSIGIIGAKLGFQVTVHMSADAKEWKKQLLRQKGVEVIEYMSDYSKAVEQGRKQAELDLKCHFIDDENSQDLFAGYAVAALRLEKQLADANIKVDANHPLFVYIPCGVGGGPGGVAYGLKQLYGEHVHIFFGEPLQSPCMLIGMMTGLHDEISVADIGLTNKTEADGLAVGRASKFVGKVMEPIISGCYTVDESFLFQSLRRLNEMEQIFAEPSAHAGIYGPIALFKNGQQYIERNQLSDKMEQATHLIWSTGGNMVPIDQRQQYLQNSN